MRESLVILLDSHLDARKEVGGWVDGAIETLKQSITDALEQRQISAKVALRSLAAPAAPPAAPSVVLIEFLLPDHEATTETLILDARVARVHAALGREVDDAALAAAQVSPVFPVLGVTHKKTLAEQTPGTPAQKHNSKQPRGRQNKKASNKTDRVNEEPFDFPEQFKQAAGVSGEPDWTQCSCGDNPQSAHREIARAVATRVKDCPLRTHEISSLTISPNTSEVAKRMPGAGAQLLDILHLLFDVIDHVPQQSASLFKKLFRPSGPRGSHAMYVVPRNPPELLEILNDFLRESSRRRVLILARFDPRPAISALPYWDFRYQAITDLGHDLDHHVAYLTPKELGGAKKRQADGMR